MWDLYSVHLFSICLSNLQNRDEWAQKEGKLWVAWVEVDECEGLVEMKAGSHLWREGLLISPLSISPGGEERWLGGGGGRGRVSRSMSCSVETLSLRFPHICPSGKRWNEDNLKIISPTSSQTTLLSLFSSFPLIGFAGEGDSLINILGSVQSCVSHLLGSTLVTKYEAHPKDFLLFTVLVFNPRM